MGYGQILRDVAGQAAYGGKEEKAVCMQDIIPIKEIIYGMIVTCDERYLKVVEVEATNFPLKENAEQNHIIDCFSDWLKVAPAKVQLKVTVSIKRENPYVKQLMRRKENISNKTLEALYESNINFINSVTSKTALVRKHYIIFEFEASKRDAGKKLSYEYIAQQLDNVVIQASDFFTAMGNSFISHSDENIFLGELFYTQLNMQSALQHTFLERAGRIIDDVEKLGEKGKSEIDIEYVNLVAPMGLSNKTSSDCVICDKTYHAYYYVPGDGYPIKVGSGWLTALFGNIPGVDIDIFWRKEDKGTFLKMLSQQMKFTSWKARNRTEQHSDYTNIVDAYQSQQYMQEGLADQNNTQDPFYVVTVLSAHASSYDQLQAQCEMLENKALTGRLKIVPMNYYEILGYKASLPLNNVPGKIYYKARRNILTDDLAGFYPFTQYELDDEDGIFLGINLFNKSICTLDLYNRDKYSNANMVILGKSGAGKTYVMSLIAGRQALLDKQVYIITSEKGHEFRRLCKAVNGTYVKFASQNRANVNIFDIRPESEVKDVLYGEDGTVSWLTKKTASVSGWMQLLFKDLTEEERILLDRAVKDMYGKRGITTDNLSIYKNNRKSDGLKEMPIIENLLEVLIEINKNPMTRVPARIFNILTNFVAGSYSGFNAQTNVDLSDERKIIVFDMEDISDTIEAATIHLTLDFIWGRVKEDPTKQKTIVIEEGWKYLSKGASESSAKLIQEIYKVIRGYGGNAILATQEIGDLLASAYGRSLIECSALKILMGVEEGSTAQIIQQHFGLHDNEAKALESYRRGACLLLAGKDHIPLQVQASALEHELITTDYRDLAKAYEKMERGA